MPEENNVSYAELHNKPLLAWKTPEFIPHPRGKRWFVAACVCVAILTVYALFTGSATMAMVFVVMSGVYYLTHNQQPKILEIQIRELGIQVGDRFYPYNTINAFWLVYKPPYVRQLYFRLGNKSFTEVRVELNDQDPVEIRQLLAREIPEVEGAEESLLDVLIRLMRLQ